MRWHPVAKVKPLLSIEETAELLGQSRASLYRAIQRDDFPLPVFVISGRRRIPRKAVERLLNGENPFVAVPLAASEA